MNAPTAAAAIKAAVEAEREACILDAHMIERSHRNNVAAKDAEDAPCSASSHAACAWVARQVERRVCARAAGTLPVVTPTDDRDVDVKTKLLEAVAAFHLRTIGTDVDALLDKVHDTLEAEHRAGVEAGIEAGTDLQRKLDTIALKHAVTMSAERMRDAIAKRFEILAALAAHEDVRARYALAAEDVRGLPATYGTEGTETDK